MTAPSPYLAFHFVFPDPDQEGRSGLRLGPRGSLEMVHGDDAVRQSILLLLSTRPGERVMRPSYGCNLHSLVFAPNDDTTAAIAIHHVRQALLQWEPRVELLDLKAYQDPDRENVLVIGLQYRVRATGQAEEVQISLDLSGGGA